MKSEKSIKFCIATDVHLGHKQNQTVRKNDSFKAFEEVLSISSDANVDFLLLGGDLFDEVNPSQKTIYKCLDILQHYVQGEGKNDLKAEIVGNPDYKINFSNQNIHVKLPIFTIHGNHDYPSNDFGKLSICDLLHVSNYANYFGKHTDLSEIIIKPLIIQKQGVQMKVAIYGLGYIKDAVLNSLFQQKKVKFHQLPNKEEYFSIFIFHQNRYKKGLKPGAPSLKCINSKNIPIWIDLTIWGHEHQAISKVEIEDDRRIFQPGSTVITSFIEAEALMKQCLMIQISEQGQIDLSPVPLIKSYRPMVCRNIEISSLINEHKKISKEDFDFFNYLNNELDNLIKSINDEFPEKKPIIKIKIQHTGQEIPRWRILQVKYAEKVANPESILTFWKRKQDKTNDKDIMEALVSKNHTVDPEQQEVSEQILTMYTKMQQNMQLYYDPRQLYKHHQTNVSKDLVHAKNYLGNFMSKQIQKKSRPFDKEIEIIYKSVPKSIDQPAQEKIIKTLNLLSLDVPIEEEVKCQAFADNSKQTRIDSIWQQKKQLLILKEDQISKAVLTQNYGQNFFVIQQSNVGQQTENSISKFEKNNLSQRKIQTESPKENQIPKQSFINRLSNPQSETYHLNQSEKIPRGDLEITTKPKSRQSILKSSGKIFGSEQSQSEDQEEDCCKKAQRTQYNEIKAKQNFSEANKMVVNNLDKKKKKEPKEKQHKIDAKKKKNVHWSEDDQSFF